MKIIVFNNRQASPWSDFVALNFIISTSNFDNYPKKWYQNGHDYLGRSGGVFIESQDLKKYSKHSSLGTAEKI